MLLKERLKIRDNFLEDIKVTIQALRSKKYDNVAARHSLKGIFDKMTVKKDKSQEYAFWSRYCFENFEIFFVNQLPKNDRNGLRLAFQAYKNKTL